MELENLWSLADRVRTLAFQIDDGTTRDRLLALTAEYEQRALSMIARHDERAA